MKHIATIAAVRHPPAPRRGRPGSPAVRGPVQRQGPDRLGQHQHRRRHVEVRDGLLICSGQPHRRDVQREDVRELRPAHRVDAHGAGRQLRRVRLERRAPAIPTAGCPTASRCRCSSSTGPSCNTRNGIIAADRLRARRALRRRRREDDARQPARRAQHVDREPRAREGRVEHLRRRRGGRRHQAVGQRQVRQRHQRARRRRRATSASSPKAPRFISATSRSWSCRRA